MKTIEVYDPALCCSTGVCGPSPDPALAQFAAALESLKGSGCSVTRYNLAQEPLAFARNEAVKAILQGSGDAALPLIFVGGDLCFRGVYPTVEQLRKLAEVPCCAESARAKPISFVKVEGPKVSGAASGCCDPSTGCC